MNDPTAKPSVAMGISFFPRGGSAQVVRYLAAALIDVGWHPSVFTGSLGGPDEESNASKFFEGLDLTAADFTDAWDAADPMGAPVPLHPSYEDRDGAPDRFMAALTEEDAERQVLLWVQLFRDHDTGACALFHLHHLTAQHDAAGIAFPDTPVVAHLHGTELKMIDGIQRRRALLDRLGTTFDEMADGTPPTTAIAEDDRALVRETRWPYWRHADACERRLVGAARRADHLICISEHDRDEACRLLGVDDDRITIVRNGVDTSLFDDAHLTATERHAHWRRWLLEEPLGWDESGGPGTRRCTIEEFDRFFPVPSSDVSAPPVLLFIGRFLGFKRVDLLVRAYARARATSAMAAPLVLWGGNPGEWEGDHPATVADEIGIDGVFFVGWRGHDELPLGINCADVMAAPSVNEPFGQVYIEAMACGRPVIGTSTGGPLSFVNTDPSNPNGWLVEPDDEEALAAALTEACAQDELERRGRNAYEQIRARYSWSGIASEFVSVYESVRP